MRIAIHQPNFIPWFPFFEKMAECDVMVMLTQCQFEKNGLQNRQKVFGKWWTKSVYNGTEEIANKSYADGQDLVTVNMYWIEAIAMTLGIDTEKIFYDAETDKFGTERIIEICEEWKADEYLCNPGAIGKYLDADMMNEAGIKIVPFYSVHKKHVFEIFNEMGIEKASKLIRRRCRT